MAWTRGLMAAVAATLAIAPAASAGTTLSAFPARAAFAPPAPVITTPAQDGFTRNTEVTLAGTAEQASAIEVREDGQLVGSQNGVEDGAWRVVVADRAEGAHVFTVTAKDAAGDSSPGAQRTVTVDTTEPVTAIDSHPPARTNLATARFTYSANEPATFTCRLLGPGHETDQELPCPAEGITYENLARGDYSFRVRAVDRAGNADDGSENFAFTVNPDLPATPGFTTPADDPHTQVSTTVTLGGTGSDGSNVIVEEDGQVLGAPIAVASGTWQAVLENVKPGEHTYDVHAENAAGATVTVSRTVIVQAVPVITYPEENGLVTTEKFAVRGTADVSAQQVTLLEAGAEIGTGAVQSDGTWLVELRGISDGTHVFVARAGALESAARSFRVDATPPETAIATGPGEITNNATPTFTFTSEAGATFECSLDDADFAACPASYTISTLADGQHTLAVRAVDPAGNRDLTPESRTFTVDTAKPAAPAIVTPKPGSASAETAVRLTGTTEAGTRITVYDGAKALGAADVTGEAWELLVENLSEATHSFTARAVDAAGNESPASEAVTYTVDRTGPAIKITSGPDGPTRDTAPTFAFEVEAGASVTCLLDDVALSECTSPKTLEALTDGAHSFRVSARDQAGNVATATRGFTVDTKAPTASITGGPDEGAIIDGAELRFEVGLDEPGSALCVLAFEGVAQEQLRNCTTFSEFTMKNGNWTFQVIPTDTAGNVGETLTRNFTVAHDGPQAVITSGPAALINTRTPKFEFDGPAGSTFKCSLIMSGVAYQTDACLRRDGYSPSLPIDFTYTFSVVAYDRNGDPGPPATLTFTVDTRGPAATVSASPAGIVREATFTFSASEPGTFTCALDGGPASPCSSPYTPQAEGGGHTLSIVAYDELGNASTPITRRFTLQVAPAPTATATPFASTPTPTPTATPTLTPAVTPAPTPEFQESVVVRPTSGTIKVKRPGSNEFVELKASTGIPVGSTVDAKNGKIQLTSEPGQGKPVQKAIFYGGIFLITQPKGVIDLKLVEELASCSKQGKAAAAKPRSRQLWGEGKGAFRTSGKYSSATVRGTTWLVQDSCSGTLTRVKVGVVQVTAGRKSVLLRAGKSYLAKPRR